MSDEKQFLQETLDVQVNPVANAPDFNDSSRFKKMNIDKSQVSMLTQSLVPAAASGLLSNAYFCKFPEGLPHTLMKLKQGGFASQIIGAKSQIAGSASFYPMAAAGAFMGVFTVMSAITGQYFLAEINSKLEKINQNVSAILAFLYGNKKAELASEISFIQQIQRNYVSIMQHEQQQIATIAGIQNAKKVAMKDIEFYLYDLDLAVQDAKGKATELSKKQKVDQIVESLELSLQLYISCCILEPYFSNNFDDDYIEFIIEDTADYVSKYQEKIRTSLGMLHGRIFELTAGKAKSYDLKARQAEIEKMLSSLPSGEGSVRQQLKDALYAPKKETNVYLTADGEAYLAIP